ncbi:MAG: phosphoadenylyl-sulfate reductase [Alphaproteobacteria bacterium]
MAADPVRALETRLEGRSAEARLVVAIREAFSGRIALVSSFGAESAVLLHMIAGIDPALPILFLDTRKLFGETPRYRDRLAARFGLTDIRVLRPDTADLGAEDADGILFQRDPDRCCAIRKGDPLARGLDGFDAWITGRKRFQGGARDALPVVEFVDGRIKINPLADWGKAELDAYFTAHDLPRHPLEADGFPSIGCMSCTDRVAPGEDVRAGRWRGRDKTECGIHGPGA